MRFTPQLGYLYVVISGPPNIVSRYVQRRVLLLNQTVQLLSRIEDGTSLICGPATGLDQDLILMEERHEGNNP